MTPKVFTLRREKHRGGPPCDPSVHTIFVAGLRNHYFTPRLFTRLTGLSLPVGGSLRVRLVPVRDQKRTR